MTSGGRPEHELPDQLADIYLEPAPAYRFDVLAQTSRMRQRPRWTFLERWIPMTLARSRAWTPVARVRPVLLLGLLLLALAAAIALAVGAQRRLPPPFGLAANGQIVYSVDGDIYVRATADAPARLLIGGSEEDSAPWFSRRGDRFIYFRTVKKDTSYDLWVADPNGAAAQRVAGPFIRPDSWDVSPDGTTALIGHHVDGQVRLTLVPLDGAPARDLEVGMDATWPSFRPPDGRWISFRGGDPEGAGEMYLVRPDGSGLQALDLEHPYPGSHDFAHGTKWSDDGSRLGYVKEVTLGDGRRGLRVGVATVDPDGRILDDELLEFDPTADAELNPTFIPGSDELLVNTVRDDEHFVSLARLGSTETRQVGPSSTGGGGIDYVLSPDAKSALVLFWNERTSYVFDLTTLEGRKVDLSPTEMSSFQRRAP